MSRITNRSFVSLPALLLPLFLTATLHAGESLPKQIETIIEAPRYKHSLWGVLVVDAKTGETIYERNPDKLFAPASVTKLFTTAAALGVLGSDYRFRTPVYQRGELKQGKLRGDLIVVGKGDLTFGGRNNGSGQMAFTAHDHTYSNFMLNSQLPATDPLAGIKDLAKQIHKAGIREILGNVLIDSRLFVPAQTTGTGPDHVSAMMVNDTVVDLIITPGKKAGDPVRVEMRPGNDYVEVENNLKTVEKFRPTLTYLQATSPVKFQLMGQINVGREPLIRYVPIASPTEYARALLMAELKKLGLKITVPPEKKDKVKLPDDEEYQKLPKVAEHVSLPLAEAVKVTLKVSHNLYASALPVLMAVEKGKKTLGEGLRIQGRFFKNELRLEPATFSFSGGAGGSRADRATPRTVVDLIQKMSARPEFEAWVSGFPVLGVDGTLANVGSEDSPAKGKVRAKTGTMTWRDQTNGRVLLVSKALAGVMTTKQGRTLYFAMFVNNVPLPKGVSSTREGNTLGQLCEIIHQGAPAPAQR